MGVAKVLSTTRRQRPCSRTMSARACRSGTRIRGLLMVSTSTTRVEGRKACRTAAGSQTSTCVKLTPKRASSSATAR